MAAAASVFGMLAILVLAYCQFLDERWWRLVAPLGWGLMVTNLLLQSWIHLSAPPRTPYPTPHPTEWPYQP